MKFLSLSVLALSALQVAAFAPPLPARTFSSSAIRAEAEAEADPFESYAPGSALAFKELSAGTGEPSVEGDVLECAYSGRLLGKEEEFNSSEEFFFKVGGGNVMPGFDKGLQGAKAGSKRILKIPPKLAYGASGKQNVIPPNADLEFTIEVKSITQGFMGDVKIFGETRAYGLIACTLFLALSPMLPDFTFYDLMHMND